MTGAPILVRCRSLLQFASFGPIPPRTPGRPDAQVPEDPEAGPAIYAKLPHVYFYDANHPDDPAFGFIDIEVSVQRRADDRFRLDLYCTGDGHQSGAGLPSGEGLRIDVTAGDEIVATVAWEFREVSSGRCDPVTFGAWLTMKVEDFRRIDRISFPPSPAVCRFDG
jgi:hypothetical protein